MFKLPSSNILSLSLNVFLVLQHRQGMSNNSLLLSTFVATPHKNLYACGGPDARGRWPEGPPSSGSVVWRFFCNPFLALRQESLTWVSAGYSHTHLFRVRDSELEKILERDDLDESVCHVFCSGQLRG